jgi:hypothetical protein
MTPDHMAMMAAMQHAEQAFEAAYCKELKAEGFGPEDRVELLAAERWQQAIGGWGNRLSHTLSGTHRGITAREISGRLLSYIRREA